MKGKCPLGLNSPNKTSAIPFPDSAPGNPAKITPLTCSNQGTFTVAGALIITIVFLFTFTTLSTKKSPPCHDFKSGLSPLVFSTCPYSSPESA